MEDTLAFKYRFVHESGRIIIAQSSAEFSVMQMGDRSGSLNNPSVPQYIKNFKPRSFGGSSETRLGYKQWEGFANSSQYQAEEKLNKFWEGAIGMEKIKTHCGYIGDKYYSSLHTGYFGCPLKRFLAEIQNQAIMEGDLDKLNKAKEIAKPLYGNMLRLMPANK